MKIPHTVDKNTMEAYKSVPECEMPGNVCSSNFTWDSSNPEKLADICVRKIVENWKGTVYSYKFLYCCFQI